MHTYIWYHRHTLHTLHTLHTCTVHVCVHDIYIHIHHYYRRLWMHTIEVEVSPKSVHV
jgi:hypothetical protein